MKIRHIDLVRAPPITYLARRWLRILLFFFLFFFFHWEGG